ncbi:MAG: hypothetical protein Q7T87_21400 [Polaromonas sp.]|nr:hypothetical protein [Polaromonas sp.]
MRLLRHITFLHRLVLAWFVMSLGVAGAGPILHPQSIELVCSSAGAVKVIVHGEDGAQEQGRVGMDCPLCAVAGAPSPLAELTVPSLPPLARAVESIPSARIAAATKAPLPARGPPKLS